MVGNHSFYWIVNKQIVKCLAWDDRKAVDYVEELSSIWAS